jgi:hypothetical protein
MTAAPSQLEWSPQCFPACILPRASGCRHAAQARRGSCAAEPPGVPTHTQDGSIPTELQLVDALGVAALFAGSGLLSQPTAGALPFAAWALALAVQLYQRSAAGAAICTPPATVFLAVMLLTLRSRGSVGSYFNASVLDCFSTASLVPSMTAVYYAAAVFSDPVNGFRHPAGTAPARIAEWQRTAQWCGLLLSLLGAGATWGVWPSLAVVAVFGVFLWRRELQAFLAAVPVCALALAIIITVWVAPRNGGSGAGTMLEGAAIALIASAAVCALTVLWISRMYGFGVWDLPRDGPWVAVPSEEGRQVRRGLAAGDQAASESRITRMRALQDPALLSRRAPFITAIVSSLWMVRERGMRVPGARPRSSDCKLADRRRIPHHGCLLDGQLLWQQRVAPSPLPLVRHAGERPRRSHGRCADLPPAARSRSWRCCSRSSAGSTRAAISPKRAWPSRGCCSRSPSR